jgi:hypothetical protein
MVVDPLQKNLNLDHQQDRRGLSLSQLTAAGAPTRLRGKVCVPDAGHAKERPGGVLLRVCPPRHYHRQVFKASSFVSVGQSFKSRRCCLGSAPTRRTCLVGLISDLADTLARAEACVMFVLIRGSSLLLLFSSAKHA